MDLWIERQVALRVWEILDEPDAQLAVTQSLLVALNPHWLADLG